MKPITPIAHGYLDYLTVLTFLIAPKLIGLDGFPAFLSYTLAGVHFALTLATDFQLGWLTWLQFRIHGWIEKVVGPALVLIGFTFIFSGNSLACIFYLFMGLAIVVVGWLTDYSKYLKQASGESGLRAME
ncbi:MAG: hypothetical protein EKK29_22690 [Hyphomicrobiales bacterium]|nr:MAG: hypothetical protein EKK29_22690 [Hyphomicrobiales bacterium]